MPFPIYPPLPTIPTNPQLKWKPTTTMEPHDAQSPVMKVPGIVRPVLLTGWEDITGGKQVRWAPNQPGAGNSSLLRTIVTLVFLLNPPSATHGEMRGRKSVKIFSSSIPYDEEACGQSQTGAGNVPFATHGLKPDR